MSELTQDDLHDLRDSVLEQLNIRFDSVDRRLDVINGRVRKTEDAVAGHAVRLEYLELAVGTPRRREVDVHPPVTPPVTPPAPDAETRPITRRDIAVLAMGAGAMYSVGKGLEWFVRLLIASVRSAGG